MLLLLILQVDYFGFGVSLGSCSGCLVVVVSGWFDFG